MTVKYYERQVKKEVNEILKSCDDMNLAYGIIKSKEGTGAGNIYDQIMEDFDIEFDETQMDDKRSLLLGLMKFLDMYPTNSLMNYSIALLNLHIGVIQDNIIELWEQARSSKYMINEMVCALHHSSFEMIPISVYNAQLDNLLFSGSSVDNIEDEILCNLECTEHYYGLVSNHSDSEDEQDIEDARGIINESFIKGIQGYTSTDGYKNTIKQLMLKLKE